MTNNNNDENVMFPILLAITFISFGILTFLHDPFLHSIPAWIFGWQVENWNTGVLTGQTTVSTINATMWQLWWYYMLPSVTLCSVALLSAILKPSRIVAIPSLVLFMLNLASLDPTIIHSDSYNGLRVLLEHNYSVLGAYAIHYAFFIGSLGAFALFLYINLENKPSDSIKRRNSVIGKN